MGFADRVSSQTADIMGMTVTEPFDAAITMHVQMNVEDKQFEVMTASLAW